ncbi:hypothetical protein [Mangrovicoccus ximenensis]|uniref:hypothetical protein n=1 Tax=Mangrovicoccus ximenensis TaxID=1911570 RepID=UPI0038B3CCD7
MLSQTLYRLTADRDPGKDPKAARRFGTEFLSLSATKIADGLIDPKLVLAWLFSASGVPGYLTGALVPVREAGALLPQLALAEMARKLGFVTGDTMSPQARGFLDGAGRPCLEKPVAPAELRRLARAMLEKGGQAT